MSNDWIKDAFKKAMDANKEAMDIAEKVNDFLDNNTEFILDGWADNVGWDKAGTLAEFTQTVPDLDVAIDDMCHRFCVAGFLLAKYLYKGDI